MKELVAYREEEEGCFDCGVIHKFAGDAGLVYDVTDTLLGTK